MFIVLYCNKPDEDDIIQPHKCSHDEDDDIFKVSRKHQMEINRQNIYRKYCAEPKPMYVIICDNTHVQLSVSTVIFHVGCHFLDIESS